MSEMHSVSRAGIRGTLHASTSCAMNNGAALIERIDADLTDGALHWCGLCARPDRRRRMVVMAERARAAATRGR